MVSSDSDDSGSADQEADDVTEKGSGPCAIGRTRRGAGAGAAGYDVDQVMRRAADMANEAATADVGGVFPFDAQVAHMSNHGRPVESNPQERARLLTELTDDLQRLQEVSQMNTRSAGTSAAKE
jgi:hypothetical protein